MYLCNPNRGVEQQVARRAHNPKVAGSSPVPATKLDESEIVPDSSSFLYNSQLIMIRLT